MLVDDHVAAIRTKLSGGGREIIRFLDPAINASVNTLTPATEPPAGTGDGTILEIDYELLYVFEADTSSPYTLSVSRGYGGTTAAAHDLNDLITFDPLIGKQRILDTIHGAIDAFDAGIYKVTTTTVTFQRGERLADLTGATGTVRRIIDAHRADEEGGDVQTWDLGLQLLRNQSTSLFPSGYALRIPAGSYDEDTSVRVTYATSYTATDHAKGGTSALPATLLDAVEFRAMSQFASYAEAARLNLGAQGQARHPDDVPATSNARLADWFEEMAQRRLSDERARLLSLYPMVGA